MYMPLQGGGGGALSAEGGDEIRAVAVSANGKRVMAGGDDALARVWPLETPRVGGGSELPTPWELAGHDDWIYCVALTADGTAAATGSGDGTMRLWRLPGQGSVSAPECVSVLNTQAGCFGCGLSADGAAAISGSLEIRRWDVGRAVAEHKAASTSGGHIGPVLAVAVCADGKTALSVGGKDGRLKLWSLDVQSGKKAPTVSGELLDSKNAFRNAAPGVAFDVHELPRCLGLSFDGAVVACGTDEGALLIWDYKPARKGMSAKKLWPTFGTRVEAFCPHGEDAVVGLAFGAGHDCVTISEEGELAVVDCDAVGQNNLRGRVEIRLQLGLTPKCLAVRGSTALVGAWTQPTKLLLCDLEEGCITELIELTDPAAVRPRGRVQAVDLTDDGATAIVTTSDEPGNPQLWLYRLKPPSLLRHFDGLSEWVSRGVPAVLAADGMLGCTVTWDRRLHVWDLSDAGAVQPASLLRVDCSPVCLGASRPWARDTTLALGDDDGGVHFLQFCTVGSS